MVLFSAALNLLYLAPSIYMLQVYDRVLTSGAPLTLLYLSVVLLACLGALAFLDSTRMRLLLAMSKRLDRLIAPQVLLAALQRDGRQAPLAEGSRRCPRRGDPRVHRARRAHRPDALRAVGRPAAPRRHRPRDGRQAAGQAHVLREFDTLRTALTGQPAVAAVDAPWTPIYIAVCFLIHPWIGTLALLGGVALVTLAFANHRAMHAALRASDQTMGAMYALQIADSNQADTARALGMQEALVTRQMHAREAMSRAINDSGRNGAFYSASTKFLRLALQSGALGLGAYLALDQQISAGGIIAASILASRAFAPLEMIVGAWRQFEQGRQSYAILKNVLATLDAQRDYTALPPPQGALVAESVTVRAPTGDRFLLMGASFRAEPGDIVGIVGPSGAGKTTLLRTIAGAIVPDGGAVRLDGAKLTDWEPDRIGRHIGYLPQDVGLFAGTIGDNIARFDRREGADTDRAVVDAAKAAGAHEMILALPRGYDTEIGHGGRGLSAGQAQRVALARALYGEPVLLALDEPNAHLDSDGEVALMNTLRDASQRGVCSIVVAHRAGLMSVANKLMIVRDGRIEAYGPREQIIAKLSPGSSPRPVAVPSLGGEPGARS